MKNLYRYWMSIALLLLVITNTVSAQKGRGAMQNQSNSGQTVLNLPKEDLSEEEIAGLTLMREEEKLARDVYLALYEEWNAPIFNNIAQSEQQHTDMVKVLLDKYEIGDLFIDEAGVFSNQDLAGLYSELVTLGSQSLIDALTVGMTIEDLDIYDLENALESVDNTDIQTVYENLMKGSRNHLRSFYSQLTALSGTYEPQYISVEEFEAILASDMERGPANQIGNNGTRPTGKNFRRGQEDRIGAGTCGIVQSTSLIKAGNYPNPANPTTMIQFSLNTAAYTTITIFNSIGQTVRFYDLGYREAGEHLQNWDARDTSGRHVTSGIYIYRIQAGNATVTHRLMLLQ